ncbi:unnamed protein product [Ceratitis capitata]|uniref:(Mediterranean fruit fly) hypothetical protein n=1 Tax=Ceratitis capitata TaxID=7213 RepID=A0A811UZ63_CERCA|nr:unnamed protein product [Ceratitis capitata]
MHRNTPKVLYEIETTIPKSNANNKLTAQPLATEQIHQPVSQPTTTTSANSPLQLACYIELAVGVYGGAPLDGGLLGVVRRRDCNQTAAEPGNWAGYARFGDGMKSIVTLPGGDASSNQSCPEVEVSGNGNRFRSALFPFLFLFRQRAKARRRQQASHLCECVHLSAVGGVLDNAKIAAAHSRSGAMMLDIKTSADYLSRSTGSFSNFSMLFADSSYKSSWGSHGSAQSQGYSSNALGSVGVSVGKSSLDPHSHLRQPDPYQMFGPTSSRLASSGVHRDWRCAAMRHNDTSSLRRL